MPFDVALFFFFYFVAGASACLTFIFCRFLVGASKLVVDALRPLVSPGCGPAWIIGLQIA